jgi:alpha-glucosidase (family GH31 glycosyl hydrolase)
MYYSWPSSAAAYDSMHDYQYMLGEDIIVRPVVEPMKSEAMTSEAMQVDEPTILGAASTASSTGTASTISVSVWLPSAPEGWVNWNNSEVVTTDGAIDSAAQESRSGASVDSRTAADGTTVRIDAGVNTLPIFVRAGTVLPLLPLDTLDVTRDDAIVWALFPGGCGQASKLSVNGPMQGGGSVYMDDGETTDYEAGSSAQQTLAYKWQDQHRKGMNITIEPVVVRGDMFKPPTAPKRHTLELRCPAVAATGVSAYVVINGTKKEVSVCVQGPHLLARPTGTLVLDLPGTYGPRDQIEAVVTWAAGDRAAAPSLCAVL